MFEFAILQNQRRPPTLRYFRSLAASCAAHVIAVQILIAYPGLLGPGIAHWFRPPAAKPDDPLSRRAWRVVTVLDSPTAMRGPSAATLRANTYDWVRAARAASGPKVYPRIPVRWGNEPEKSARETIPPAPQLRPVPGLDEPVKAASGSGDPASQTVGSPEVTAGDAGRSDGAERVVYLPAPQPIPEPRQIPKKLPVAADLPNTAAVPPRTDAGSTPKPASSGTQQAPATQVFENRQQAIQSEGSGFFDTKGFPLGEYASAVIERVKGNWMIPSNLRNSHGRTTVVFFIGRDGKYTGAQVVRSSGNTSLDLAALNAVLTSNPFPPLPQGFPGSQVGAKFVFAYNEQQ